MEITLQSLPKAVTNKGNYEEARKQLEHCIEKFGAKAKLIRFDWEGNRFTFSIEPNND